MYEYKWQTSKVRSSIFYDNDLGHHLSICMLAKKLTIFIKKFARFYAISLLSLNRSSPILEKFTPFRKIDPLSGEGFCH